MTIALLSKHLQTIANHAEKTYPEECCGLLLGTIQDDHKILMEVLPTENVWDDDIENSKKRRYAIAPEIMLKVQQETRDRQLKILGIYHSHPDYPAIPSQFDLECAWEQYSYIIVSVQQGKTAEILSWYLKDFNQFQSEQIVVKDS